jgi:phage gp16-like protein
MSMVKKLNNRLVTQIKISQKQASICDDDHKANVLDVSNQRVNSCTGLTEPELKTLLARYKKMAPKVILQPQLKFIFSLWSQIHKAGGIRSGSTTALKAFCKNHLNGQTLNSGEQYWPVIITVLKKFLARVEGGQHV